MPNESRLDRKLRELGMSLEGSNAGQKKVKFRLYFPQPPYHAEYRAAKQHNGYNFVGFLLGQKGSMLQRIQQLSGTKIEIHSANGNLNGAHPPPNATNLHAVIIGDSQRKLQKAAELIRERLKPSNAEFKPITVTIGGQASLEPDLTNWQQPVSPSDCSMAEHDDVDDDASLVSKNSSSSDLSRADFGKLFSSSQEGADITVKGTFVPMRRSTGQTVKITNGWAAVAKLNNPDAVPTPAASELFGGANGLDGGMAAAEQQQQGQMPPPMLASDFAPAQHDPVSGMEFTSQRAGNAEWNTWGSGHSAYSSLALATQTSLAQIAATPQGSLKESSHGSGASSDMLDLALPLPEPVIENTLLTGHWVDPHNPADPHNHVPPATPYPSNAWGAWGAPAFDISFGAFHAPFGQAPGSVHGGLALPADPFDINAHIMPVSAVAPKFEVREVQATGVEGTAPDQDDMQELLALLKVPLH